MARAGGGILRALLYQVLPHAPAPDGTSHLDCPLSFRLQARYGSVSTVRPRYTTAGPVPDPVSRREWELREVLEDEIAKEGERQAVIAGIEGEADRLRLGKLFAMEREAAKRHVLELSSQLSVTMPEVKRA